MHPSTIRVIAPTHDLCGEGAVWDAAAGLLYWTDINRSLIHACTAEGSALRTWHFAEPVTALALTTQPDRLLVALASRLIYWHPATDERHPHGFTLATSPAMRLNDGRADPVGAFWVGSMHNNVGPNGESCPVTTANGALHRIDPQGGVTIWREQMGIPNTLCWSPDHTRFYHADTTANEIRVYTYDQTTGAITDERPFFTAFARGVPDGSAIDADGHLYNCRYGGACIIRITPDGTLDRIIEFPTANPTTCTFGGPTLHTLFITSAALDTTEDDHQAGNLFALDRPAAGLPEHRFGIPDPL